MSPYSKPAKEKSLISPMAAMAGEDRRTSARSEKKIFLKGVFIKTFISFGYPN
jgi:hypothetical protein